LAVRTERGLDRLVTFLDAVVAIAITLLVLPLIEFLADARRDRALSAVLGDHLGQFGAFALSFAVIARLWLAHHRLIEQVGAYDSALLLLNLAWAFTIVVLPFSTQLVAVYGSEQLAVGLYIGTIAASSLCLSAIGVLVWRRPALRRGGLDAGEAHPAAGLLTSGVIVVALVLGVLVPAVNYFALFLLFLTGPLGRLVDRRTAR
jgi:uncharacterized membrane protein